MARLFMDLRAAMAANDYTQKELARKIGMGRGSLCGRMRGEISFKQPEMYKIAAVLGEPFERIPVLFPPQGKRLQNDYR